jgi:hypothetical protein
MPHSWVKIPTGSSDKLRNCMDGDTSKGRFKQCLHDIVEADGGHVERVDFDLTGTYAYAIIDWSTFDQKVAIVFDTGPVEVVDLTDSDTLDDLLNRDP